jgi:hypothetical protein
MNLLLFDSLCSFWLVVRAALVKSISRSVERELASLSFYKKQKAFLWDLAKGISGWVGFNVSTNLPHDRVGVSPIVGLTYSPIEDLVKKLCRPPFSHGPTLSTAVGYLTPESRFLEWVFDPTLDADPEIAKIIRAIQEYGVPFMREHASLHSIITELEGKRFTINDTRRYRSPAAYLLAGRKEEALRFVEQELKDLEGRTDSAGAQFRDYAKALKNLSG